ncbi:MAG: hypothetical protein Kow0037_19080 [Calditrichia bacterium]
MLKNIVFSIISLTILCTLLAGCTKDNNEEEVPARVRIVPKAPEDALQEHGIDAVPETNGIFLEWYPNDELNLDGYAIYRSTFDDRGFKMIAKIPKEFGIADTFYVDEIDSLYTRFYYYVRAYNNNDKYGAESDTVDYELVDKPILQFPQGNLQSGQNLTFVWDFIAGFIPNSFIFRLERRVGDDYIVLHTKEIPLRDDYAPHQEWGISELQYTNALSPGIYRWRIDPIGAAANQGAESDWLEFRVP